MQFNVGNAKKLAQATDVVTNPFRMFRTRAKLRDESTKAGVSLLYELSYIYPQRIVSHLHRLVELEGLFL